MWAKNNPYEFVVLVLLVNIVITIYSLRAPEHHGAVDKMLYFDANGYCFCLSAVHVYLLYCIKISSMLSSK